MTIESETDFRWPHKGDRLLRADDNWQCAIRFAKHEVSRHAHIWGGYVSAGHALVDECERRNTHLNRHEIIYPILFCYRHALELAIKWIIERYGRFAGVSQDKHTHHDLWQLWLACKQVICDVGGTDDDALFVVEGIIKEFHELDRGSFAFRYSRSKDGMTIRLPEGSFDLANIKDVMESVNNFFTGADGQLDNNSSNIDWQY